MVDAVETAYVKIWGALVGAVAWDRERGFATFEFESGFLERGLDLAPLRMPIAEMRRGGFDFHANLNSLPDFIRRLDVDKLKRDAGLAD